MIFETLRAALILSTILTNVTTPAKPLPQPEPATLPKAASPLLKPARIRNGIASWYGRVLDRHRTASGEIFDSQKLTGASNTLPFGSRIRVTNLKNGRSVIVEINDRGILSSGRIIDLSAAAADRIGMLRMGVAPVRLEAMAGF